jgi:hypothetical protein
VLGFLSPGINQPWREADHSPLSTAKVKNAGALPVQLNGVVLRHRGKFVFTFLNILWVYRFVRLVFTFETPSCMSRLYTQEQVSWAGRAVGGDRLATMILV